MLRKALRVAMLFTVTALAENTAQGEFAANGNTVQLTAITVENSFDSVGILATEQPLPAHCGVFDSFMLAIEGKIRGVAISISKESKKIEPAGANALFHESWNGRLGNVGEPSIQIEHFDEESIKGMAMSDVTGRQTRSPQTSMHSPRAARA